MRASTSTSTTPRQANTPVAVLAPRDAIGLAAAQRGPARVLQTSRAPAQLSLFLRPRSDAR